VWPEAAGGDGDNPGVGARTRRTPPAAPSDIYGCIFKHRHYSAPRPQSFVDWMVWLALWPIVMALWLVAVPFFFVHLAVGFITEALPLIRVRRSYDSDWPASAGMRS